MQIVHSFQSRMLLCTESFSFFEKGKQYYCIYDTGSHFYIWCNNVAIGVNEIKLVGKLKKNFTVL